MSDSHAAFSDLFDEYCGIGRYEGKPVPGGFRALDEEGLDWRRSCISKDLKHFLRVKNIMETVFKAGEEAGEEPADRRAAESRHVDLYDQIFASAKGASTFHKIIAMVELLRGDGYLLSHLGTVTMVAELVPAKLRNRTPRSSRSPAFQEPRANASSERMPRRSSCSGCRYVCMFIHVHP
jgi:hypothetical protein